MQSGILIGQNFTKTHIYYLFLCIESIHVNERADSPVLAIPGKFPEQMGQQ
jgi:hypothetical protein